MKLKLTFIVFWCLLIILLALPARAQDKYKVHLTNGRSIACAKYWYEGDKILLTTATDITFGFDKKEVVKIEGMEEIGARPAESPKTLPASPATAPPAAAGKPLPPYLIPSTGASPKPNVLPGSLPDMKSLPPGPWLPQGLPPAATAPSPPLTPPATVTPPQPSALPAAATPPPSAKSPAAAVEEDKSPPEEPEIIMDEVQEEKEEPEPMEPPEEN